MPDTLNYRLVIVDPVTQGTAPFAPGDATVDDGHFWVTSLRDDTLKPYISAPPEGEGERIEPLDGKVSDASYTVRVADVDTGGVGGFVCGDDFNNYRGVSYSEPGGPGTNYGGPWSRYSTVDGIGGTTGDPDSTDGSVGTRFGTPPDGGAQVNGGPGYFDTQAVNYLTRTFGVADGLLPNATYTVSVQVKLGGTGPAGTQRTIDGPPIWRNILLWGVECLGDITYSRTFTERLIRVPDPANPVLDIVIQDWSNPYPAWQTLHLPVVTDSSGNLTVRMGVFLSNNWFFDIKFDNLRITQGSGLGPGRVVTRQLTDASGLQRMLARPAWLEETEDEGTTWRTLIAGYVTRLSFPTAMEAEFSIGDTRRVERTQKALAVLTSTYGNGTPIIGGPTVEGFGPVGQYGLPTFEVVSTTAAVIPYQPLVVLEYKGGPLPPGYIDPPGFLGRAFAKNAYDVINERARRFFVQQSIYGRGWFPRIRVDIEDAGDGVPTPATTAPYSTGSVVSYTGPTTGFIGGPIRTITIQTGEELISKIGRIHLDWPDTVLPSVGDRFYIRMTPLDVSSDYPLHVQDHPCDVVAGIYTDLGVPYDTASLTATKAALGNALIVALRITSPEIAQTFIERLFGLFGFATRMGDDGEREFFVTRLRTAAAGTSLDMTDLREPDGSMWDLDEGSICNIVKVEATRFGLVTRPILADDQPFDWLEEQKTARTAYYDADGDGNPESDTYGERPTDFTLPGIIGYLNVGEADLEQFTKAIATQIFTRHGRGAPVSTFAFLRNATTLPLKPGDDIALDTDHRPTITLGADPTSDRGGVQEYVITQRIDTPAGPRFRLLESTFTYSGTPGTAPIVPTFTIAQDPNAPAANILYEITNGATLTAAAAVVEVYIGFGGSAPTDNGSLLATHDMGTLSAYKFTAGPYFPGTHVWIRMRSKIANQAWSAFTAWDDVTLDALPAFPSVTQVAIGDTAATFSWTNTSNVHHIQVQLVLGAGGGPTSGPVIDLLPTGTAGYTVGGLTANTEYTITFSYTTGSTIGNGTGGTGTAVTFTTTNTGLSTLSAPIAVRLVVGQSQYGVQYGAVTMEVVQPQVPADVVFEMASETAVGSGLPDTYSAYAVVTAIGGGGVTSATAQTPNDGLMRFFRAKASQPGYTDSAYSSVLSLMPWSGIIVTPGTDGSAGTPVAPSLSYALSSTGVVDVSASVDAYTVSVKFAAGTINSSSAPASATVRAATADTSAPFTASGIATLSIGESVVVGAYAYDTFGNESRLGLVTILRPGGFANIVTDYLGNIVTDSGGNIVTA